MLIVVKKKNDGLAPRKKLMLQILFSVIFYILVTFIYKDINKEFGLDFTPKTRLETKFTPSKLNISYDKDKIDTDLKRGTDPYKFVKGGVEISLKQKPGVTIEYIGGWNLFPTGNASTGAHIDKRV